MCVCVCARLERPTVTGKQKVIHKSLGSIGRGFLAASAITTLSKVEREQCVCVCVCVAREGVKGAHDDEGEGEGGILPS